MYGYMAGWAWLWMTLMTLVWVAVLGAVIYVAVTLANRDSKSAQRPRVSPSCSPTPSCATAPCGACMGWARMSARAHAGTTPRWAERLQDPPPEGSPC